MGLWDSIVDIFTTGKSTSTAGTTAYKNSAVASGAALGNLIGNLVAGNKDTSDNKNNSSSSNKNSSKGTTASTPPLVSVPSYLPTPVPTPTPPLQSGSSSANKNSLYSQVLGGGYAAYKDPEQAVKDVFSTVKVPEVAAGGALSSQIAKDIESNRNKNTGSTTNNDLSTEEARKEQIAINNAAAKAPQKTGVGVGVAGDVTGALDSIISNVIPDNNGSASEYIPSAPPSGYYNGANWSGGTSYKPYPTAEEMSHYVSTIIQAAKNELGDVVDPEKQGYIIKIKDEDIPKAPDLRTLEDLAEAYGITYDYKSIYKKFNDSVEKQYDAIYAKQKQNEDAYYDNASAAQNTLLDTLSRDRGNAVQAGVSKGMQAANALGAMLGVSQQFANNATTLSQERSNTAKSYGADLAKAVVNAEATSNERRNAIMEIAKMLYGYDSEQYVANMDNYNTILTNNAALQQSYMNNSSNLQNALASIFGGVANNKIMGDANVQSSLLAAEAQKLAAQYAAEVQKYAAQQSLAANKYNADINKEIAQMQQNSLKNEEVNKA